MSDPVADKLVDLIRVLQGNLQVTTRSATASDFYIGFSQPISAAAGANPSPQVVWAPPKGNRYILRGFLVTAIVRTGPLAATGGHVLSFSDSGGTLLAPIASYASNAAVETILTGPNGPFPSPPLGDGVKGSAIDATINLATGNDIAGGAIIRVAGLIWGTVVAK